MNAEHLRIGSLFSGYGGLEMAVENVTGATTAWVSDIDKGACKILDYRYPDIPNLGDITAVDWAHVEPVNILTGGSPCQDLSHAGKRSGMAEGTRSNLWVAMREAIAQLRPGLVVWENVRGAYSAKADSEVEPCPGCVGDGSGVSLRALGRVLGDLSSLGYVGGWHGLRAADVGAPHGRFRVFVVAWPAGDSWRLEHGDGGAAADTQGDEQREPAVAGPLRDESRAGAGSHPVVLLPKSPRTSDANGAGSLLPTPAAYDGKRGGPQHVDKRKAGGHSVTLQDAVHSLLPTPRVGGQGNNASERRRNSPNLETVVAHILPTPRATDGTKGGPNQRGSSGDLMLPSAVTHLLPTPAVNDMGEGKTVEAWDEWTAKMKAEHGNGNGHGASLAIEAQRLVSGSTDWGQYAGAITRWESLTRAVPAPTQLSKKGMPQIAPAFSEWMLGLPAGWVTDVPGITRNNALAVLGNGVVPQQAEAALRFLLARLTIEAAT